RGASNGTLIGKPSDKADAAGTTACGCTRRRGRFHAGNGKPLPGGNPKERGDKQRLAVACHLWPAHARRRSAPATGPMAALLALYWEQPNCIARALPCGQTRPVAHVDI